MPELKNPLINHQAIYACAISILIFQLSGCREILPYRTSAPEISGILLQNGAPLPDVVVYSCLKGSIANKRCGKYKKTTTDSQGNFYFESASEFIGNVSQLGDSSFDYNINFLYGGREYHWSAGGGEMPENVNLRCDISHQQLCTVHHFNP
jgi:hypothetical protein